MSTHRAHPPFCRYAQSRVWAPLFRNSGSAPDVIRFTQLYHLPITSLTS